MAYLKSYENMGTFSVTCQGCSCPQVEVDGHQEERNSQLFMQEMVATQADECIVIITNLPVRAQLASLAR